MQISRGLRQNGNGISFLRKMSPTKLWIEEIIDLALAEDLGKGDITTEALIPSNQQGAGIIVAKEAGILAGIGAANQVFYRVDPELKGESLRIDGVKVKPGTKVAKISGSIASILKAERVALNFLQHLSGIASETNRYVEKVEGLPVRIMDTRKTTPSLRSLEKYAVRVGGGTSHRMNLGDGVLIKDNHLITLRSLGLNIKEIIAKAKQSAPQLLPVEVEVRTVPEALEVVEAGADIVMLDNMSLEDMRKAVKSIHGRALIEASGGITLDNVRAVAETGVNFISIGALTHSARALDISLELEGSDKSG
jgi:nicotinate-nucleotide pyrophosphorylase (carboxylating)